MAEILENDVIHFPQLAAILDGIYGLLQIHTRHLKAPTAQLV